MHIGLYFGSFNPIHNGHLIVAEYMRQFAPFDKIRFVVSPHNPFKEPDDLMDDTKRLEMVKAAIADNENFELSDIEFSLSKPSYTIQTLERFKSDENAKFSLIMGSDNIPKLHEWKDIDKIAEICSFHIYNRRGNEMIKPNIDADFYFYEAPFIDISATHIRTLLAQKKSVRYLVPDKILPLL